MIEQNRNKRYDPNAEHPAIDFTGDPGMTIQEPTQDADINVLMKRFGVTDGSVLPNFTNPNALYGDLTQMPQDPVEIAEIMRAADLEFLRMPADLRQRFANAQGLHNYLTNPANLDEAIKLGLLSKELDPTLQAATETAKTPAKEPSVT